MQFRAWRGRPAHGKGMPAAAKNVTLEKKKKSNQKPRVREHDDHKRCTIRMAPEEGRRTANRMYLLVQTMFHQLVTPQQVALHHNRQSHAQMPASSADARNRSGQKRTPVGQKAPAHRFAAALRASISKCKGRTGAPDFSSRRSPLHPPGRARKHSTSSASGLAAVSKSYMASARRGTLALVVCPRWAHSYCEPGLTQKSISSISDRPETQACASKTAVASSSWPLPLELVGVTILGR